MATTLNEKLKRVGVGRRKRIEARATQLIAEEMSLRELRQAHKYTQKKIAKALHIGQDGVSRLEQRTDLLLSTLRSYVEAMGGSLSIIAEFPNRRRVIVSGLSQIGTGQRAKREEEAIHC